jgi:hypothetical protein
MKALAKKSSSMPITSSAFTKRVVVPILDYKIPITLFTSKSLPNGSMNVLIILINEPFCIKKIYMSRKAIITTHNMCVLVECYEEDQLIRTIDVSDHSYRYAEDTAENWELGIITNDTI